MDLSVQERSKINQPCAACRMLRRRCGDSCVLAPYFPPHEAENFAGVHKVFGASNVIKMIQMVEETKREDAVKSMVYEARARLRDRVYGSAGAIFYLQRHVKDLAIELEQTRAKILESQQHRDQLLEILMNAHHLLPMAPVNDAVYNYSDFLLNNNIEDHDPIGFPVNYDWIL